MSTNLTFLRQVQLLLERTYAPVGINFEDCLVTHERCVELSAISGSSARELSMEGRTFLRVVHDRLYVAIYYHPKVIAALEKNYPLQVLNQDNIRPLIVFIEELNHALHASLLFLQNQFQIDSENSLCDLELQAKIDTYLALKLIAGTLCGRRKLTIKIKAWLQSSLFGQESFDYDDSGLRRRYQEASQLGLKLVRHLDDLRGADRTNFIRHFRRLSFDQKKELIESLPS